MHSGKIELVLSLLSSGMLCNCNELEKLLELDIDIKHKDNCIGMIKAQELISGEVTEFHST